MRHRELLFLSAAAAAVVASLVFSSCSTTPRVTHILPPYEPPLVKNDYQHVRTTAYTHTESDHRQYGARNALGGQLRAATPGARRRAEDPRVFSTHLVQQRRYRWGDDSSRSAQSVGEDEGLIMATIRVKTKSAKAAKSSKKSKSAKRGKAAPPTIGSAAADWSRWPAGTTFRLISTGQIYRVEDYGWALAGRNTIDLYMSNSREMNSWGAREEPIQVLHWGDPNDSLKLLMPRMQYKHVRRMVLELQGNEQEAAAMQ